MTNKKKLILFLACLSLLVCIGSTAYTYAKYNSESSHDIGTNIKKWKVIVNGNDLENGSTLSENITANFKNNEHIAENKIAPGSIGSFEIELDYSNIEVSFEYEISIEDVAIADIQLYSLTVDDVEIETTDGFKVSNTVDIKNDTDDDKIKTIVVTLYWNDEDGSSMSNEDDTNVAIDYDSIDFNVNLRFTQIKETT